MKLACGIDFGTSNSAVAVGDATGVRLVPLQAGSTSVPTALFFSFEDSSISFGREAVSRHMSHEPGRFVRAIKSLLGSSLFHEQTQIRIKSYSFSQMITEFLSFLRQRTAAETELSIDNVVLGRPVYFVDDDRDADNNAQSQLQAAVARAGYKHIEFQFEPVAAALNYEQGISQEELALVVDIGGGTSDFSVLRVSPHAASRQDRRDDILSFDGVHIGGTDFDRRLSLQCVMPLFGHQSPLKKKGLNMPSWYYVDLASWHRINFLYDPKVASDLKMLRRDAIEPIKVDRLLGVITRRKGHELLSRVEAAKIDLTSIPQSHVNLSGIADDLPLPITRSEFEASVAEGLNTIVRRAAITIKAAGVTPERIQTIFLTGGSSAIPALQAAISKLVPQAKMIARDVFGGVAMGLALDAKRRFS
jgi:hypothetical chaperone protein